MTYYNEIDAYPAQWVRNLIAAGEVPEGPVDEQSIETVTADDVRSAVQAHFFAGLGGWPYALRLAGWPDDRPVWTGSCPCQPLSSAGRRQGHADRRHLWPAFYRLIAQCRPATIFGEQVAGKDGREWLSAVRTDLEGLGYAVGCADLAAASVGAPHIRQRLFWVADSTSGLKRNQDSRVDEEKDRSQSSGNAVWNSCDDGLADSGRIGVECGGGSRNASQESGETEGQEDQRQRRGPPVGDRVSDGGMGDSSVSRVWALDRESQQVYKPQEPVRGSGISAWDDIQLLPCADGKTRVTQPGLRALAYGVPNRVGKLRAYGNAIVPALAAEFVMAFMVAR